jgi:hypothetical protein
VSAAFNCALNCTNTRDDKVAAMCSVKSALGIINQTTPICSAADVLAARWVKLYWDSDDDCSEGYDPSTWPGIMLEKTCCSTAQLSQQCNAPGATAPSIKCFGTKSSVSTGYCAGKTANFSVCAASQTSADERVSRFAQVRINMRQPTLLLNPRVRFG